MNAEKLRAQLRFHEGIRYELYQDSLGNWTYGIGRNVVANPLNTQEQLMLLAFGRHSDRVLDFMLDNDIKDAAAACESTLGFYPEMSEVRQAVVLDMVFNLGVRGFLSFEKFRAALADAAWQRAADEMLKSKWAIQVGPRASRLSEMMRSDQWPTDVPGLVI